VLLTVCLAALTLAVGLSTAVVSSYNHQRGANLSDLQRDLEILRAANDQAEASAAAHVWGQPPAEQGPPVPTPQVGEEEGLRP
jgi:predicted histidine transporter YuiF (NhaC family)